MKLWVYMLDTIELYFHKLDILVLYYYIIGA